MNMTKICHKYFLFYFTVGLHILVVPESININNQISIYISSLERPLGFDRKIVKDNVHHDDLFTTAASGKNEMSNLFFFLC
jgi:hypothetical protein